MKIFMLKEIWKSSFSWSPSHFPKGNGLLCGKFSISRIHESQIGNLAFVKSQNLRFWDFRVDNFEFSKFKMGPNFLEKQNSRILQKTDFEDFEDLGVDFGVLGPFWTILDLQIWPNSLFCPRFWLRRLQKITVFGLYAKL